MDGSFSADLDELNRLFQAQKQAFSYEHLPTVAERQQDLQRFANVIRANRAQIVQALNDDFSSRSENETLSAEIALTIGAMDYLRKRLKKLAKPKKIVRPTSAIPGKTWIRYMPKGVVGVVAPWNYPVQLALVPAATAIAAGNRVLIKPSEVTPHTSALLAKIVADAFDPSQMAVAQGGVEVGQAFSELPFDHMFFTGSPQVGRLVAEAAGRNLTPLTLELGGKSPCFIMPDADLDKALPLVAMGKTYNAGQTCIAPDYLLVPRGQERAIADGLLAQTRAFFPDIATDPDYSAIVSERHADRMRALIADAEQCGAQIIQSPMPAEGGGRKIPPTFIIDAPAHARVMQEEIFGPLLPIIPYDSVDTAIAQVNGGERPLALYVFGEDTKAAQQVIDRTVAGGASINTTIMHFAVEHLPMGGIGNSGYGTYHGDGGFYELSHAQGILEFPKWKVLRDLVTPPYSPIFKQITNFLIGK